MSDILKPQASMTFTAQITLTEAELRLVQHLSSYNAKDVQKALQTCTREVNVDVLAGLMEKVRAQGHQCIKRFDAARQAFQHPEATEAR